MSLEMSLLQQENLDLQKALKLARSEETAAQGVRLLSKGTRDDPINIAKIKELEGESHNCYRCGSSDGHAPIQVGAIKQEACAPGQSLPIQD